jgi:DNA-directed RNA polymerase alpha subunit
MSEEVKVITKDLEVHTLTIENRVFKVVDGIVSIPKNLLKKVEGLGFKLYDETKEKIKEEESKLKEDLEKVKNKLSFKK